MKPPNGTRLTLKLCEYIRRDFFGIPPPLIRAVSTLSDPVVSQISEFSSLTFVKKKRNVCVQRH